MLWIVLAAMTVVAAVGLTFPLVRRYDVRRASAGAVEVLKGQLAEIDAEAATRTLGEGDRAGLRTEALRRILAEAPLADAPARPLGERSLMLLGLGMAAMVAVGGAALYLAIGRPDLTSVGPAAPVGADHRGADVASMVAQLEAKMKASPNDPQGWRMLGWSYMQLGRYADAAGAYGRAAALDPNSAEYPSAQGEALTQAAGGQVTPAAQDAFQSALAKDGADPRARYYLAVARDQRGDHAGAMADWIALLKSAPPDAPWTADVRAFVMRIAKEDGEDIAARLPPAPVGMEATAQPGPSPGQIAAARAMPAGDRQAMIAGMVDRLAARLKANPRDSEGWVRLMRARMVLGDPGGATGAYREALEAFKGSPAQEASLREAARGLQVPGT